MKNRKQPHTRILARLPALALALMMALNCMVMPTMALEDDAARISMFCSRCKQSRDFECVFQPGLRPITRTVGGCSKINNTHSHVVYYRDCFRECPVCGMQTNLHSHTAYEVCNY